MSGSDLNACLLMFLIDIQKFPGNFVIKFLFALVPKELQTAVGTSYCESELSKGM